MAASNNRVSAGGRSKRTSQPNGRPATRLPRAFLEEAFVRLTAENARLRREVLAHASLWQIAHQDPLTRLWNRRYADERLAEEMSRAKRESDYRFSLVLVDVDNMKRINDQLGHASGDEALKWVARFLKQGLRGHDLCCRLGGDEFLLILPGSGERECHDLVERIRRRWVTAADGDPHAVAVSVGTASFPTQGQTVETLFGIADDAMYTNKRQQDPSRPPRSPRRPPHPPRTAVAETASVNASPATAAAASTSARVAPDGRSDPSSHRSAARPRNRVASF